MPKSYIHVAFAINDRYVQHLAVVIASILENKNQSDNLFFHVISSDLASKSKNKILSLRQLGDFAVEFLNPDSFDFSVFPLDKPATMPHAHVATYYRLVLASLLSKLDRVIFLDSDLVVNCSLHELYEWPLAGALVAGVEDILSSQNCRRLEVQKYCNAGVLLLDLQQWRRDDVEKRFVQFATSHRESLDYLDQDIINCVLQEKLIYLPTKYNAQVGPSPASKSYNQIATQGGSIIHYVGSIKPWHALAYAYPFGDQYRKYLRLTPFRYMDRVIVFEQSLLRFKHWLKMWLQGFGVDAVHL